MLSVAIFPAGSAKDGTPFSSVGEAPFEVPDEANKESRPSLSSRRGIAWFNMRDIFGVLGVDNSHRARRRRREVLLKPKR